MSATTIYVVAVLFFATLFRSAFGFGVALVAAPLLALCMPMGIATPLCVLISITVAALTLVQDWDKIHVRSCSWLLAWSAIGIPVGLICLLRLNGQLVKGILAVVIIGFALVSLVRPARTEVRREKRRWLAVFGFAAGVLGGAYGINGPPLVVYGAMQRWSAERFRATLQGYFLPAGIIGMIGFWAAGLWTRTVNSYFLISLPLIVLATVGGREINRRLHGRSFMTLIYIALIAIGGVLLMQSLRK
ncbi:MAG TPA: sulfite exporter TauE/SafE family protein [Pirellulales bacterium]|nr:sulfite exporter TauE/SafE family protein [Pirellulales bacterium]